MPEQGAYLSAVRLYAANRWSPDDEATLQALTHLTAPVLPHDLER